MTQSLLVRIFPYFLYESTQTSNLFHCHDIVEEVVARTDHETLMKIYNLPQVGPTLEFLTMLALVSGRLLKVS